LRSVVTHTVYGIGLYASAWIWAVLARWCRPRFTSSAPWRPTGEHAGVQRRWL